MPKIFLPFFTRLRQICEYALIEETTEIVYKFILLHFFPLNDKRFNIGKSKLKIFSYAQLTFNTRRRREENLCHA